MDRRFVFWRVLLVFCVLLIYGMIYGGAVDKASAFTYKGKTYTWIGSGSEPAIPNYVCDSCNSCFNTESEHSVSSTTYYQITGGIGRSVGFCNINGTTYVSTTGYTVHYWNEYSGGWQNPVAVVWEYRPQLGSGGGDSYYFLEGQYDDSSVWATPVYEPNVIGQSRIVGFNCTFSCSGPINSVARHTLYFNANGGSVYPISSVVAEGNAYGGLPIPTRDYYNFVGWYDADGNPVSSGTTMGSSDTTIYAYWSPKSYIVDYRFDWRTAGDLTSRLAISYPQSSYTYTYGKTFTMPTLTGYTFTGWSPTSILTTDAGNKVVVGSFVRNYRRVVMNAGDGGKYADNSTSKTKEVWQYSPYGTKTSSEDTAESQGVSDPLPIPYKKGWSYYYYKDESDTIITDSTVMD